MHRGRIPTTLPRPLPGPISRQGKRVIITRRINQNNNQELTTTSTSSLIHARLRTRAQMICDPLISGCIEEGSRRPFLAPHPSRNKRLKRRRRQTASQGASRTHPADRFWERIQGRVKWAVSAWMIQGMIRTPCARLLSSKRPNIDKELRHK